MVLLASTPVSPSNTRPRLPPHGLASESIGTGSESISRVNRVCLLRILVHQHRIRVYRRRIRVYRRRIIQLVLPPSLAGGVRTARGPGTTDRCEALATCPLPSLGFGPDENCHNTSTWSCLPPPRSSLPPHGLACPHTVSPPSLSAPDPSLSPGSDESANGS